MNKYQKGVTLIELMIAVAIVGILAAIATPSYTSYITKTMRTEALRELARVANLQEEYFADNLEYSSALNAAFGLNGSSGKYLIENGLYEITVASVDNTDDYLITATAIGAQATNDASCVTITLSHLGEKSSSDGLNCWQ